MTAEAFGEKLRRQRERRGVSLQSIADETKISGVAAGDHPFDRRISTPRVPMNAPNRARVMKNRTQCRILPNGA